MTQKIVHERRNTLTLLGLLCAAVIAWPITANGMYDPKHGRWLQRDFGPKAPDPARADSVGPGVVVDLVHDQPEQYTDTMSLHYNVASAPGSDLELLGTSIDAVVASSAPDRAHSLTRLSEMSQIVLYRQYQDGMNLYQYVRSNPGRFNDPKGMDIYLKTGNNTSNPINNALHQNVCVDTWDRECCEKTGLACFSYGYDGHWRWWWFKSTWLGWSSITLAGYLMEGEIYEADDTGEIAESKKTTCVEDKKWLNYMRGTRVGTIDVYSAARHNCRKYAQWEYADAP
jgi:hypothetical protein